jgi:hypothetical protein
MEIAPGTPPVGKLLFEKWSPIINSHKNKPATEIEVRFGRKAGNTFDTNVGQKRFDATLRALEKYKEWESTHHTRSAVYYFEGSKRLTVDEDTDEQVGHVKKRICVDDFNLASNEFDVRLAVSSEEPYEYDGEETSTQQKSKERWSFVRKNLSIDLSIIKGDPIDKDSDEDTVYQIELEIVEPSEITTQVELFNILYKIFDVLNCSRRV